MYKFKQAKNQLLNKIIIPAILAVTILIAGVFAIMPIDKAATVHTTILASQTERDVAVKAQSSIGTSTIALIDISVDKDFTVEIGQFLVDSTSSSGTVIVEQIIIEDASGAPFHVIEFTDETIDANTGRIVFPSNGTHAFISMPANWSVVIHGKGGNSGSDSNVMIGVIAAADATFTIGP